MILGIDTSLPVMSVALLGAAGPLGAAQLEGRESRNEKLLPSIEWLLREVGADRRDVSLLAVTRGPGSFTGVRIGLATAEGLALALRIGICAMSTHEAIASSSGPESTVVYNDAGRGEFYVAAFEEGREILPYAVATVDELAELKAAHERAIDVRRFMWRSNVALCAAEHAGALRVAGALATRADTTPVYVRLAEAEARLVARDAK
jgi:tRNA threonylcarbamoyladenosine biosynthesis protein TsaB